jgi:hypothetical protein
MLYRVVSNCFSSQGACSAESDYLLMIVAFNGSAPHPAIYESPTPPISPCSSRGEAS